MHTNSQTDPRWNHKAKRGEKKGSKAERVWEKAAFSCSLVLKEYIYFPLISNALVNSLSLSIVAACDLSLAVKIKKRLGGGGGESQKGHVRDYDSFTGHMYEDNQGDVSEDGSRKRVKEWAKYQTLHEPDHKPLCLHGDDRCVLPQSTHIIKSSLAFKHLSFLLCSCLFFCQISGASGCFSHLHHVHIGSVYSWV